MIDKNKLSSRFKKFTPQSNIKQIETKEDDFQIDENASAVDLKEVFKNILFEKIEKIPVWFEYTKDRQKELIRNFVDAKILEDNLEISDIDKDILLDELCNSVSDFGVLQPLLDNNEVNAVFINGTDNVYIEIKNKILNTEIKLSESQLKFIVSSIFTQKSTDFVNTIKKGKFIITRAGNYNLSIRKTPNLDIVKEKIPNTLFKLLCSLIEKRKNIVIAGGINSGKTVLLDVLLKFVLNGKRCFLLENNSVISSEFDGLVKFCANSDNYSQLIEFILKSLPEYVISDLNTPDTEILRIKGGICTMRANSVNDVLQTVIGYYIKSGLPEKFAKIKTLENIDNIVLLNDGAEVFEISHARTSADSVKSIAKFKNYGI